MSLLEWTTHIIRMRDMRTKHIDSMKTINNSRIDITKKDSSTYTVSCEKKLTYDKKVNIYYCDNTKENVKLLYGQWSLFSQDVNIRVTFVNSDGSFWTIIPFNHAKITPVNKLLKGLDSLYKTSKG